MNRPFYFLMVGLAFTVLQVSTVAAQTGAPVLTIGDPLCQTPPAIGCPPGSPGLTGTNMAPPTTMAPNMGNPNMPPATMAPPPGAPHMPPMTPPPGAPTQAPLTGAP